MSTTTHQSGTARPLLFAGSLAGPIYVVVGTLEATFREGFDITRHSLSLVANGASGWVHIAMMVVTGLLTVGGAVGLAGSFPAGHPAPWAPRLIGLFGLGVAISGVLIADPADGFPVGTPAGMPQQVSWHGLGHLVAGSIGFLGLIIACILMWRWFRAGGNSNWAIFSLITGVLYFVTFAGIATGAGIAAINIAFTIAVIAGWTWLTLLFRRAAKESGLR